MIPTFGPSALISAAFARARLRRRAAFIPFLVAGDPDQGTSKELILAAARGGADLIELGIPFSDPIADGPVIAEAAQRALRAGMTFARAIALGRSLRKELGRIPLVAFAYYNVILKQGIDVAAAALAANGFSGVVVPDVPFEDACSLVALFGRYGLAVPLLIAPTTPALRAARIAASASGFVYVVRRMGVTGTHSSVGETRDRMAVIRAATDTPVAVGFGVSSASEVGVLARSVDGVIVGSALVDLVSHHSPAEAIQRVSAACASFAAACASSRQAIV